MCISLHPQKMHVAERVNGHNSHSYCHRNIILAFSFFLSRLHFFLTVKKKKRLIYMHETNNANHPYSLDIETVKHLHLLFHQEFCSLFPLNHCRAHGLQSGSHGRQLRQTCLVLLPLLRAVARPLRQTLSSLLDDLRRGLRWVMGDGRWFNITWSELASARRWMQRGKKAGNKKKKKEEGK